MFKELDDSKKWVLSMGKCIDDELFVFGAQYSVDHPSRSLIVDPYDENYTQYNVFTPEELEEIKIGRKLLRTERYTGEEPTSQCLNVLLIEIYYDERSPTIRTTSLLHSGLSCTVVGMGRPSSYVSRVARGKKVEININIEQFGSTVVPTILYTWSCCEMVKDVLNIVVNTFGPGYWNSKLLKEYSGIYSNP